MVTSSFLGGLFGLSAEQLSSKARFTIPSIAPPIFEGHLISISGQTGLKTHLLWRMNDSGWFVYKTFSSENFVSDFFSSLSRFRLRCLCLYLVFDILVDNFGTFCVLSL